MKRLQHASCRASRRTLAAFAFLVACSGVLPAQAACRPGEASFFRDEALTMKVTTKLQFTKALMREKIRVKVTGGVAMLSGGVSSAEQIATAVRIARQVEGVRCVDNFMKVGPPEADNPREP
ncbi:BON domain-containing protein [Aquabacterium sp. A7-Y]|uniref:BON domain-containing protein n=1 Tax=Aquabacterium sp. A7-Y TaxID=1349605 RepID=UPI00223DCB69|nr:BON domain-containing protein [Aquabacterium sp. A7-Y]MCW7538042.1 BON domain-containing protein [Aquabacterium sp. A7-Y]